MSTLCQRNRASTATRGKESVSSNWGTGVKAQRRALAPATPLPGALPPTRWEKVLAIRLQIAEGTYDPDKRIDAILDRLLVHLVA